MAGFSEGILLKLFSSLFILCCLYYSSDCARILASVATPSYSHQVAFRQLWRELAKRGHQIILLTTDPMEHTDNITQIDLSFSYEILNQKNYSSVITNEMSNNNMKLITEFTDIFMEVLIKQIEHTEVQEIIMNEKSTFDVLMIEMIFPVHIGLIEKFKAPVIALSSMEATHDLHAAMGNEVHTILYPDSMFNPNRYPLTLWQRILSTISRILLRGYLELSFVPSIEAKMRKVFGEDCRPLKELYQDIDMLFSNSNPIFHHKRALTPNTITFGGGSHMESDSKPLPADLQTFLDNATNGVVYVSLGTNIKSNSLKDDLKQIFLDTFAALPYQVLWKYETENITIKSRNVLTKKWIPQREVLRHPNVKLFVTQCGLQSSEEAILNRVPMVGLPFIADQLANAYVLEEKGFGIRLDHSKLTKQIFKESIDEVIKNPKYKEKVIEIAELLTDVEMSGLEQVVWWTEYVIRNKGAKHLKVPILESAFYKYYMLDVIALVISITIIWFSVTLKIISMVYRRIFMNKRKVE
ncbi:hypothetical protein WA026_014795 [Henosepilachna vigintioctopunctata]|uniref:UDP-glucuronosyltransferase n=1 Tax=Henosepilachna vigintioctopunctata TaxID=420089 RepID=A0AAW1US95_9CUCU